MFIPAVILTIEDESDREFMTRLYENYKRLMFSEISKVSSVCSDREDILNDSLVKLIGKINLLRSFDRKRLVNYIITTVRNTTIDYCRRDAHFSLNDFAADVGDTPCDNGFVEDTVLDRISIEEFHKLWPMLNGATREILEKKYILGQSDSEIAQSLGIKASSVRMNLSRARKSAYEQLKVYME